MHVRDEIHRGVAATTVGRFPQDERLYHVRVPAGVDLDAALAYYQTCADVQYAQKNLIYHITETTPNDTLFGQQWGWKNTSGLDVGAIFAWGKAHGRFTVVVANIDTGVDYTHPDLGLNIWTNPGEAGGKCYNGIDDDGDGYIDDCRGWNFVANTNDPGDDNGHGTHTSGTIGAMTNNYLGVAGANWDIQIMPLKAFDVWGNGTTAYAISALDYAVAHRATISNNSWGTTGWDPALLEHIQQAETAGHLFIAAAGNSSADNDTTPFYYPCDLTKSSSDNPNPPTNIICVAATDQADNLAWFSNYGASTVHLGAPGVGILSTLPGSNYGTLDGTSMATAHVTGGAALLKGCKANLDWATIKSILLKTARPVLSQSGQTVTGGVVNYQDAIDYLLSTVGGCDPARSDSTPVADPGGPYKSSFKKAVQFDGTRSYDTGGSILLYSWDFGDGTFGAGAKPTHQYAARGTFTVVLTVRDNLGAFASQSTTVIIPPASHN